MRALAALPVALVLLAGCASDPEARLRSDTAAVLDAANERDADRVRARAADLESTVAELQADGALTGERAAQLTALARSIVAGADLIDEELLEKAENDAERERLEEEARRLEQEAERLEAEKESEREDEKKAEEEAEKAEEEAKKDEEKSEKRNEVEVEVGEDDG